MAAELHLELEAVAGRLASAELELECKGYSERDCRAVVKRATRYARGMAELLPAHIQGTAFQALLDHELRGAEKWLEGVAEARLRGDFRRGSERALRDNRWAEGIERFTGRPVSEDRAADYAASLPEAAQSWEASG